MARPRSFDRARVVESATRQFWRHGLHGTSAEDLCRVAGLGRSSFYNTFGSKDAVFEECLDGYLSRAAARGAEVLTDDSRGALQRIEALLTLVAAEEAERRASGDPTGCLAVNTVTELADDGEHRAGIERVQRDTTARLALLSDVLRAGQAAGEITTDLPADGLAAYVNAAIAGLRVSSQRDAPDGESGHIVRATLRALRP